MDRLSTGRSISRSACSATSRRCSRQPDRKAGSGRFGAGKVQVKRRVVVTGMGIVSSIGNNTQEVLASLREAKSGITRAEDFAAHGFKCQVQGRPTLDPAGSIDRRAMRFLGPGSAWNHVAMEQAIRDSGV